MSSLLYENCSSLKDQFLKIKERFSAPSPTTAKNAPVSPASPGPPDRSASVQPIDASTTLDAGAAVEEDKEANPDGDLQSDLDRQRASALKVEVSSSEQAPGETHKQDSKKFYSGEVKWPQQTQVERWYVEDNYFKGSMTCWTMDKGADIVSRIATVVSSASSPLRINPDISLQWIGRQLWAITVSLPLTRSGELKEDHIALARRIDEVITAEEIKHAPHSTPASSGSNPPTLRYWESDNQVPTIVICDAETHIVQGGNVETASVPSGSDDERKQLPAELPTELVEDSGSDPPAQENPPSVPSVTPQLSAKQTEYSNSAASTLVDEDDYARDDASPRSRAVHEDGDVVASLPLSWSMLSTTSLPESAGLSINGGNDARDDDTRCAPEKTGWLKKKTGLNSWQQRYFELKGNRLYYFANETDGVPRGAIILDHAHVLRGKGDQSMAFSITTSSSSNHLQILKFSARMTPQVHL